MELRTIGEYAFADCGELVNFAVPPTVCRLAENAFSLCMSLKRLSLPEGFTAVFNEDWVVAGNSRTIPGITGRPFRSADPS